MDKRSLMIPSSHIPNFFYKVDIIFNNFNNIHDKLNFTVKVEKNKSISFLDLNFSVMNEKLYIDWYRKETCSGRYLHYYSVHPLYATKLVRSMV